LKVSSPHAHKKKKKKKKKKVKVRSGQVRSGQVRSGQVRSFSVEVRTFPERWRRAKLVLIPKDDGTEDRKFRPICLIDALGKVLEHLIKARLQKEVDERGGLSDNQFGFRQGLSTMDAVEEVLKVARFSNSGSWGRKEYCGLVALDVENAFNTASWERIVTAMDAFEV
jgi:hypothetical protein